MKIAAAKETSPLERRIAITPDVAKKLVQLGAEVLIERGLGEPLFFSDEAFIQVGAKIIPHRKELMEQCDVLLRLHAPNKEEISSLKKQAISISFLDPFQDKETVVALQQAGISSISLEMMPRTTICQKMDALSSQANLAGYVAIILAANSLKKILPMMTTPAGTISPVKVFIIGVGVAGLQAIATARRLGCRVEAFDTRPVVEEQVKSLGAKFVKIDLGETGQTKDGYAKVLTAQQLEKQKEGMTKACQNADIVITTAQLFGRKAPRIIDKAMIEKMKPGSVIVDLAIESGGNVEGSEFNKTSSHHGVQIIGLANMPGEVALDSSQLYAMNLYNLIQHFWNKQLKRFIIRTDDSIFQGCLITHEGSLMSPSIKEIYNKGT